MPQGKHFLDNREELMEVDQSRMLETIEQLASQCQQVWEVAQNIEVPNEYQEIDQVVVAGMGGSALGTHVIQSVYKDQLKAPVVIVPDYTLPAFVNEKTLVIGSSYSGTTEETIAAMNEARARGAKLAGITSGGKVAELLREWHVPSIIFPTTYNPSGQPRMGLGYSIFGQMSLFKAIGLLNITQADYDEVISVIANTHLQCAQSVDAKSNQAKLLAFDMLDKLPVIVVAEHLEGVAHVLANQLNENAKTYSEYRVIPEMNHHLMEGLQFPETNVHDLLFVSVESQLYSSQNAKRMKLTQEVLTKHALDHSAVSLKSESKLGQAFELLLFGSYTSYYLALLHNVDPAPIPWVDWFKDQLKK